MFSARSNAVRHMHMHGVSLAPVVVSASALNICDFVAIPVCQLLHLRMLTCTSNVHLVGRMPEFCSSPARGRNCIFT
jgi:hypothetical protein